MRVKLEKAEVQVAMDDDLVRALETLARIEAGLKVLTQKVAAIDAGLAKAAAKSENGRQTKSNNSIDEMLTTDDVCRMIGMSRSSLWRKKHNGSFPKPHKLSHRRVGWPRSVVEDWLEERKDA